VKLVKDSHKFWYKPHITREEAIALLRHRHTGTFVVRDSNSFPGAFGLALKVASPPVMSSRPDPSSDELVRHFLIEPTSKGVKLKGYSNEPVFGSLSALVYQHTLTPLALPTKLILPSNDLSAGARDSIDSKTSTASQMQLLLSLGAACNVHYLFTLETDSLTGPQAIKKTVSQMLAAQPQPTLVHFKVSSQGITLTDNSRKLFFRKHYNTPTISYCGLDPEDRRWTAASKKNGKSSVETSQRIFGFVARKPTSRNSNQCHVFAEQDPEQPARAVVNFVNKVLLNNSANARSDVV
jgi:tensin